MPDPVLVALNRYGLGARIGERARLSDPRGWLRAQLDGAPPAMRTDGLPTPEAIGDALRALRLRRDPNARQQVRRRIVQIAADEARAALTTRITSDRPFVERLIAFWSNHLCVSAGAKALVAPLAGSYERDAIRPHVLGRFEDMVLASARHPAMLFYLDNYQSFGPDSRGAHLGRRERGLNENYARELMELHTIGVNGGYTQQDVQELAKVLTGWTVDGLGQRGRGLMRRGRGRRAPAPPRADGTIGFAFQELLHEPGSKTVMGATYKEDGAAEGERAIRALCRHPSTAAFVARKLVVHFVADDPPPAAVDRIAAVFRDSGGDLRAVSRALVDLPEAWDGTARKFRTPHDWLVAVFRAFQADDAGQPAVAVLRQLRQPMWSPQAPKGFGDTMSEWADPDSLMNRGELSRTISRRIGRRAPDPRQLLDVVDVDAGDPLRGMLADASIPVDDRVALALAGPAFQWR
jgi:uncharacterized protein (DUF1800 family)